MLIRSLDELMGRHFHIPSYQRGYRWTEVEVEALLNDLWEFASNDPSKKEFYCLQPIVLYQDPTTYQTHLLDGQQRLTTLYILLSYLRSTALEFNYTKERFTLSYETRPDSKEFLSIQAFAKELSSENR